MPRPLLYFDTNVPSTLKGKPPAARRKFWEWIWTNHRYAVASITIAEIAQALHKNPTNEILRKVRVDLGLLRGPRQPHILSVPSTFLGQVLYGRGDNPIVPAAELQRILEAGRSVQWIGRTSKGVVLKVRDGKSALRLSELLNPLVAGQESMRRTLEDAKARNAQPLESEEWASYILRAAELPTGHADCHRLAAACSAAYLYQRFLWEEAVRKYNPAAERHRGDWMDIQFLFYLADPNAVFVTGEEKLPLRIAGSGQEGRVKRFADLWDESGAEAA